MLKFIIFHVCLAYVAINLKITILYDYMTDYVTVCETSVACYTQRILM